MGLANQLAFENLGALRAPLIGLRQIAKVGGRDEYARCLADEVIVRRGTARELARDIPDLEVEGREKSIAVLAMEDAGFADQVVAPDPVDDSNGEFQGASPVHAPSKRAFSDPRVDLRDDLAGITRIGGGTPGAREDDELVMSRRLPDDLAIPGDVDVAVVDPGREPDWCADASTVVEVPADRRSNVAVEIEERQPMIDQPIGTVAEPRRPGTLTRVDRTCPSARFDVRQSKRRVRDRVSCDGGNEARGDPDPVRRIARNRSEAPQQLACGHAPSPSQVPTQTLHGRIDGKTRPSRRLEFHPITNPTLHQFILVTY